MADETLRVTVRQPRYRPFHENPDCRCYPNGIAATLCMTGHMTECHWPRTCEAADCEHYRRAMALGGD